MGVLSTCSLVAQTAGDSVRYNRPNKLLKAFEEVQADTNRITAQDPRLLQDSIVDDYALPQYVMPDTLQAFNEDSIDIAYARELEEEKKQYVDNYFERFNPKPLKAVWMAALLPGGGQIYNRKYWKLPIVYGGFLGLVYGYNWNQRYFKTYQNAYRDLATHSASASYLQFIRGTSIEAKKEYVANHESYLLQAFQRKRNFYRNYRDYCIVGMIGVYLISIVDAYVDAALYHFDVSPELDACNNPSMVVSYKIDF